MTPSSKGAMTRKRYWQRKRLSRWMNVFADGIFPKLCALCSLRLCVKFRLRFLGRVWEINQSRASVGAQLDCAQLADAQRAYTRYAPTGSDNYFPDTPEVKLVCRLRTHLLSRLGRLARWNPPMFRRIAPIPIHRAQAIIKRHARFWRGA